VGFLQDSPPAFIAYNTMKTIYSMGKGKYITLDSYGESSENHLWSIGIALFALTIAAIAVPAAIGIDITNLNQQNNGTPHRTSR
jgi:hypothetical protein